jgi:hypothetical protein
MLHILCFSLTFLIFSRLLCMEAIMRPVNYRGFMHTQTQITKAKEFILETLPNAKDLPADSLHRLAIIVLKVFKV